VNVTGFFTFRNLAVLFVLFAAAVALWLQPSSTSNLSTRSETISSTQTTSTGKAYRGPRVLFGDVEVFVEVADTPWERSRGLSDRDMLPDGRGMLFVFENPGKYAFWMYRMRFPLDIIWVSEDGRVVHIVENAPPCPANGPCPSYQPSEDALYVVEVNAGFAEKHGIRLGSKVHIDLAK